MKAGIKLEPFDKAILKDIKRIAALRVDEIKVSSVDLDFQKYLKNYHKSMHEETDHSLDLREIHMKYEEDIKTKQIEQAAIDRKRMLTILRKGKDAIRNQDVEKISEKFEDSRDYSDTEPPFFKMINRKTQFTPSPEKAKKEVIHE